ncbi:hypothetical protein INT46_000315 [Mucor plumbeus]|uniref:Uncharacterized protein n=1 Tax=Mucor plumbeus TaxID=97098 RepID=A0A8H7V9S9_9FUNG|nr:hypothetical protein INT46_000315 [Mucor plumbeus]
MLNFKTIAFIFLVAIFTTLAHVASCKLVVANGPQRSVVSNKRRIDYNKRDATTAGASTATGGLPNIQLPNADTTALLASAGPLLSSVSSVKIPQLPAFPGAASAAGSAPVAMAPQAASAAPVAAAPAAAVPATKKKEDDDEEEEEEDED